MPETMGFEVENDARSWGENERYDVTVVDQHISHDSEDNNEDNRSNMEGV